MKKCFKKFIAILEICSIIVTFLVSMNVGNFIVVEGREETLDLVNFKWEEGIADSQVHNVGNWKYWIFSEGTYGAKIGVDQDNQDRIVISPTMSEWYFGEAIQIYKIFEGYKPGAKYEVSFDVDNDVDNDWVLVTNSRGEITYYEFKQDKKRFTGEFVADEEGKLTVILGLAFAKLDRNYIIDASEFEIKELEADYIIEEEESDIYNKNLGESVVLKPIIKMNGITVSEPEKEDYHFAWYCVNQEGEKNQIETSYACNIDSLSMEYFYYYENEVTGNTIYCEVYRNDKKIGETEYKIWEKWHNYSVEENIDVFGEIGDEVILTPIVYDNGTESDIYNGRYRYEWYQFKWESEEMVMSELLSDELAYKISSLEENDISNYSDYIYMCKVYRGDRSIGDISFTIKEKNGVSYANGKTYYVNEGDSVTLKPILYDNENNVIENPEDKGYTFQWYHREDDEFVELPDRDVSYTVESIRAEDISQESGKFSYECRIYKNNKEVAFACFYFHDKQWGYQVVGTDYWVTVGQRYTIEPIIYDDGGREVKDIESSEMDFTWYKVENDGEKKMQISTDIHCVIESVSNDDIYVSEDGEVFNSTYYQLVISKDGVEISGGSYYLRDNMDNWWCNGNYNDSNTIVAVGEKCVLDINVYNNSEIITDYKKQGFRFEWYGYDEDGERDESKVLSTDKSYIFDITEDVFRKSSANRFECKIMRGYRTAWIYFELEDKESYVYVGSPGYYGKEGESLELSFSIYNYNGDEIEPDDSFSFEWRKYTYKDYDYEIIGNEKTYKIEQLTNNEFFNEDNPYDENVVHYECEIYRGGKFIGTCNFSIYDKESYYHILGEVFEDVQIGEKIVLKPNIYDYAWNEVSPSDKGMTLKWYKVSENNDSEYLGEGYSYVIDSVTEEDISSESDEVTFRCELWRGSECLDSTNCVVCDYKRYYISIDGGMWCPVKEGDKYTLGDAKYGYYCDGKMYKPGAEIEVRGNMLFTSVNELSVVMSNGAAIRTSTPAGLKFEAKINSDNVEAVQSESITEGMLITTNDIYENNSSTLDLTSAYTKLDIVNSGWADEQMMTYCGAVANILEQNYIRDFVAKAYATISYVDGTSITVYSDIGQKRSVNFVANKVRNAGYPKLNSNEISVIDLFCRNE